MIAFRRFKPLTFIAAIFCLLGFALSAAAQTTTEGSILGTVTDPTGKVVPNAAVTIRNNATGAVTHETTNGSGYYIAPLLQPGTYTVSVSAAGFGPYTATNVIVQVGVSHNLNAQLALKTSHVSVQVTAQAPVLNFTTPNFGGFVTGKTIRDLPVNNRRWSSLAMLTPAVVSNSDGYGLVSVHGISPLLNNVEIDGASDNQAFFSEERGRTREAYSTTAAAQQEFKVNTGVYSAQYGRAAGAVITSVTKSGTNHLHGTLYFWDRESNWAAFNNFTKLTTLDPTTGQNVTRHLKPEDLRKIYGFTVGGPLIHNKLFWIYTYDQHTHVFPAVGVPTNPAAFFAQPDPTQPDCEANGYDPNASTLDQQVCTMAARLHMTYANAATAYNAGITDLGTDLGEGPRFGYQEINNPQLDWQINPSEHLMVLYHRLRWDSPGGVQTSSAIDYARDTWGDDFVKLDYGIAKLDSMIRPNVSNELLYQYSRELDDEGQQPFTPYTKAHLIGAGGNVPEVALDTSVGFNLGSPYYSYRKAFPEEWKWQADDIIFATIGNHSLSFGADFLHNYDLTNVTFRANGEYVYDYLTNYLTDLLNHGIGTCNDSGSPEARSATDVVTGSSPCYADYDQGFGPTKFAIATMDYGFFGEDHWQVTPRLTLDLGIRYDYEALPGPVANLISPENGFTPYPQLANSPSDKDMLSPRIGFAYDLFGNGKTAIHGGFGIYYGRVTNGNLSTARQNTGSPNGQFTVEYEPRNFHRGPSFVGPNFPNPIALVAGAALPTPSSDYLDANLRNPMVYEYDLAIQHAIGQGTVAQISYLGDLGRNLPNYLDLNLSPQTTVDTITINNPAGTTGLLPNGTVYQVPTFTNYGNTALFGPAANNFQSITDFNSNIDSSYNAFVIEVQNHTLHSIQFDANYTWSHALDDGQSEATEGVTNNWYNPYGDYQVNYGNSSFNVPNRFVGYALYTFPNFVRSGSWVRYITNQWALDDTFQIQNGLPHSATVSGFLNNAIDSDWNGGSGTTVIPAIGTATFRTPRKMVDDARAQKSFTFDHRYTLHLILNAYNLANHQNVDGIESLAYRLTAVHGNDAAGIATWQPSFGRVTSSNNSGFLYTPRQLEVVARLTF